MEIIDETARVIHAVWAEMDQVPPGYCDHRAVLRNLPRWARDTLTMIAAKTEMPPAEIVRTIISNRPTAPGG